MSDDRRSREVHAMQAASEVQARSSSIRHMRAVVVRLAKGDVAMHVEVWRTKKRFSQCAKFKANHLKTLGIVVCLYFTRRKEYQQSKLFRSCVYWWSGMRIDREQKDNLLQLQSQILSPVHMQRLRDAVLSFKNAGGYTSEGGTHGGTHNADQQYSQKEMDKIQAQMDKIRALSETQLHAVVTKYIELQVELHSAYALHATEKADLETRLRTVEDLFSESVSSSSSLRASSLSNTVRDSESSATSTTLVFATPDQAKCANCGKLDELCKKLRKELVQSNRKTARAEMKCAVMLWLCPIPNASP